MPKGKSLGHEQRFLVEGGDGVLSPLDAGTIETSSSDLTLGRSQRFGFTREINFLYYRHLMWHCPSAIGGRTAYS